MLADSSEGVKTGNDTSPVSCPVLYGAILVCSEYVTEGGDDTHIDAYLLQQLDSSNASARPNEGNQRELSGRNWAILKQYFDEAEPLLFPLREQDVAFTESQIYHLLRVLTKMSCSAIERMVIGAFKGKPPTASS